MREPGAHGLACIIVYPCVSLSDWIRGDYNLQAWAWIVCVRVCVQVVQHNFVCNLAVVPESLPADNGSAAGCSLVLLVLVDTENQQPLPWEAIISGVTLSLQVPDAAETAAAAAGAAGSSKPRGGRGNKNSKGPEALVLTPECIFTAQDQIEGLGAAAAAAAAAAPAGCVVCFRTPQLTAAGCYTVAAEFRETREELLSGLKKEVCKPPSQRCLPWCCG